MEWIKNFFVYAFIIILGFMGLLYLGNTGLLLALISIGIFIYLVYKKDIPKFGYLLLITSFIIRLIVIFVFKTEPISDFKTLLDASSLLRVGDTSYNSTPYFTMWGYQTGFVIYQALMLKIVNNIYFLEILNAIYSSILVLLVYLFGRRLTDEKSARLSGLLYMIFLLPLILNTILTNQHLSAVLIYLGIFIILKDKAYIKEYIIGGILVSLGNIIRPEGIVIVTSLFVYLLLLIRKNNYKEIIIKFISFLIPYLLVGLLISNIISVTNINPSGLSNKNTLWKFVLGFNHDTCGSYDERDTYSLDSKEEEIKLIKERISDPIKDVKLVMCKTNNLWLLNGMEWNTNSNKKILGIDFNILSKIALSFNSIFNVLSISLSLFGIWYYRKDKILKKGLFFIVMILVTYGVYSLIEIQPRYAYFIEISLFITASYGIKAISSLINKKYKKISK